MQLIKNILILKVKATAHCIGVTFKTYYKPCIKTKRKKNIFCSFLENIGIVIVSFILIDSLILCINFFYPC